MQAALHITYPELCKMSEMLPAGLLQLQQLLPLLLLWSAPGPVCDHMLQHRESRLPPGAQLQHC
jgi:hypothetical protein